MSLSLFLGCMSSGKTIGNIEEATRWLDVLDETGLFIHHIWDSRDPKNIISSNSSSYNGISPKFEVITVSSLEEVEDKVDISKYTVICIDEIQFFSDLVLYTLKWMRIKKHIFGSGLISDWKGCDFGDVKELLKHATNLTFRKAKCFWCSDEFKKEGNHNVILIPDACRTGKISGTGDKIEVGGKDKYIPLCLEHHVKHLREIHNIESTC